MARVMKREVSKGGRGLKVPFATRLTKLRSSPQSASNYSNLSKQEKHIRQVVKICCKRIRNKQSVLKALVALLTPPEADVEDGGALLLAEYVAARCGIQVKQPTFLGKENPLWPIRLAPTPYDSTSIQKFCWLRVA